MPRLVYVFLFFTGVMVMTLGMAVHGLAAADLPASSPSSMASKETPQTELSLETLPNELFPGEAVLIRVTAAREISGVNARLGDQKIPFFPAQGEEVWMGLAGLDLDLPPKEHTLSYRVRFPDGSESSGTTLLKVQKKEFPVEQR